MSNLARGFAGEAEYDRLFDVAGHGRLLIYRDVWMKVDKAVLQADSLIVTGGVIVVNGIKNYSGSHLYQSGRSARENAAALRKYFIADPMTLPETDPPRVRVGNYCCSCGSFEVEYGKFKMTCRNCGGREKLNHMFARAVIDHSVLFHNTPVTKDRMHHFTGCVLNERTVRRLHNRYCDKTGRSRSTS